jgi:hypothetical protein
MAKLKAFLIIVLGVFVSSAGPLFLANIFNVFETPWSTWTIVISGGVFGVIAYLVAVCAPMALKPSAKFSLPEA